MDSPDPHVPGLAAYASQREAEVPDDLAAALSANPRAATAFAALNKTRGYAVILDLVTARSAETRERRLAAAIAALAARGS